MDDTTAIEQLVLGERMARDRGRWDRMRAAWEPEGRVRISWIDGSATEFIDGSIDMSATGTVATHRMSPTVIDIIGERATIEAPAVIEVRSTLGGVEVDLASRVRLLYRARRHEEGWKLHAMTCVYESDSVTPVVPGERPELGGIDLARSRPSYRWLAAVLGAAGHETANNLPGTDRPLEVDGLERLERDWVAENGTAEGGAR